MKNIRKMMRLSLLTTIALTIFMVEANLPSLLPIPGVKLGLANVISLMVLLMYGVKEASIVLFIRIILGSIFAGQMMALLYSIVGGVFCLIVMAMAKNIFDKKSIWFISVLGAMAHNIGQVIVAIIIMKTKYIMYYAPALLIGGIITGLFTGIIVQHITNNYRIISNIINENIS